MGLGHRWIEAIIALVVLVFTFVEAEYAPWIVAVAAVLLLVHSFWHTCGKENAKQAKKRRR